MTEMLAWIIGGGLVLLVAVGLAALRRAGQVSQDERATCPRTRGLTLPCMCGEHEPSTVRDLDWRPGETDTGYATFHLGEIPPHTEAVLDIRTGEVTHRSIPKEGDHDHHA